MRGLVFTLLALLSTASYASNKVDSLRNLLKARVGLDTTLINTQLDLAYRYLKSSKVDSTKYFYYQALDNANILSYEKGRYSAYIGLAFLYRKYQKYDSALTCLDSAEVLAAAMNNKSYIFKVLYKKGLTHCDKKDMDKTREYYNLALQFAEKEQMVSELAMTHHAFGVSEYYEGNHVVGLKHLARSRASYEKLNNPLKMASICNNMGIIYIDQKDHENAKKVLKRGIHILDSANRAPTLLYKLYINLAVLYSRNQQYDSAISLLSRSIHISEQNNEKVYNFLSRAYLTECFANSENFDSALTNGRKTIDVAKELQSPSYLVRAHVEMATVYSKMKNYEGALHLLLQDMPESQNADAGLRIRRLQLICKAYETVGKYDSAIRYGLQSFQLAKEAGLKDKVSISAKTLYHTYKKMGDGNNALAFYEQHNAYEDSISNENKSLEIGRLQARIENQKEKRLLLEQQKAKELELHRQKIIRDMLTVMVCIIAILAFFIYQNYRKKVAANKLLREMNNEILDQKEEILAQKEEISSQKEDLHEKNVELEQLNQEKNGLISVVAHDLRSPLNKNKGLAGVVKLSGNLNNDQTQCLDTIEKVCENGLQLIQEILYLNAIERQEDLPKESEVDLTHFLSEQARGFAEIAKKKEINFHCNIPKKTIRAFLDPSYLDRIVDNLVSNAIKYTHPLKNVYLSLQEVEGAIQIKVKDEGQGFSEEDKSNMFKKFTRLSAQPTGGEASSGLGLSIVKNLIDKLGGRLSFNSQQGKGTEFVVEFATNKEKSIQKVA